MNLFVIAMSPEVLDREPVVAALSETAVGISYLGGAPARVHCSADRRLVAAWVCHPSSYLGGVEYVAVDGEALALFAGRPVLRAEHGFDGQRALDPALYLETAAWRDLLDGRFVIARCTGDSVEITTDPLGSYEAFTASRDGIRWISNSASVLMRGVHATRLDRLALASVLALGWSLGGEPLSQSVRRLAPHGTHLFVRDRDGKVTWTTVSAPDVMSLPRPRFDPTAAARDLRDITGALIDWPDRPVMVSVTGGRDSRMTLAAAAATSLHFHAMTHAAPYEADFPVTADVRVARTLCEIAGVPHQTHVDDGVADVERSMELLRLITPGTTTLGDVGIMPPALPDRPLELHITGQGGEAARCFYGSGFPSVTEAIGAIWKHHIHRLPPPIVNADGLELVRRWVSDWMTARAADGVRTSDLGDAFYIRERMASWAAPAHGAYEYWADTVCPLWTASITTHMLACPADLRRREGFHNLVLRELSPQLWGVPFSGASPRWPSLSQQPSRTTELHTAYHFMRKARAELLRRLELARRREAGQPDDRIHNAQRLARERALAAPGHPAWDILARRHVERLLTTDPRSLHPRSRNLIWRLLTVFSG